MNALNSVAARIARPDMLQASVLLFVALGFTLAVSWPTGISLINEAWFSLAPVRTTLLALGALGYGAFLGARRAPRAAALAYDATNPPDFASSEWHWEAGVTLGALVVLAAVSAPFEVVAHAASYPGSDVAWSLIVPFLAVIGYFGLGLLLGRAVALVRLTALLPLLVPALLAAAVWLDLGLGLTAVNPWTAALTPSPVFAVVSCVLGLCSLWAALPRRGGLAAEPSSGGAPR